MFFPLPEILLAERAGRAMAGELFRRAAPGAAVRAVASTSPAGAAALAGARHAALLGFSVRVELRDLAAQDLTAASVMLGAVAAMDLPLLSRPGEDGREGAFLFSGANGREEEVRSGDGREWDGFETAGNPFLRPARPEDALPAAALREIDRTAVGNFGLPGLCLMENAAIGAVAAAAGLADAAGRPGAPCVILAGTGNNGGDAFAVARGLRERGEVRVFLLGDPGRLRGEAAENYALLAAGMKIEPADGGDFEAACREAKILVDGLFGTGVDRPLEGAARRAVESLARAGRPLLALDLPSGLHPDTGEVLGACAAADLTVTFAAPKPGFFLRGGAALCGAVLVASIGAPGVRAVAEGRS